MELPLHTALFSTVDCYSDGEEAVNQRRVLLVDDDAQIGRLVKRLLAPRREVTACLTLAAGLELLERDPPAVVLLDLLLPDGEGTAAVAEMVDACSSRGIPVIVLTGRDIATAASDCGRVGADDIVAKVASGADRVDLALRADLERAITMALCRKAFQAQRQAIPAAEMRELVNRIETALSPHEVTPPREEAHTFTSLAPLAREAWGALSPGIKGALSTLLLAVLALLTAGVGTLTVWVQTFLP